MFDVIIIGSGLGGLQCAYLLSKIGMKVAVIEQNAVYGGCLQSFYRRGIQFESGFHYVGALNNNEALNILFDYYNLLHLDWVRLDKNEFDKVFIGNQSYKFCNGFNEFSEYLKSLFPSEASGIKAVMDVYRYVADTTFSTYKNPGFSISDELFQTSAYSFLKKNIHDDRLINLLSSNSLKLQLDESLPLYAFAHINGSFIESAWRLKGGGKVLIDSLINDIKKFGCTIFNNSSVSKLIESDGNITGVILEDGRCFSSKYVVSDIHPSNLIQLIDSKIVRPIYRKRIQNLKNSFGIFTINIKLKSNSLKYQNKNLFLHSDDVDMWHFDNSQNSVKQVMVSYPVPDDYREGNDVYATTIDLLTPVDYSEWEQWSSSKLGARPQSYYDYKTNKAEEVINFTCKYIPELRDAIDVYYTSSPLTYSYYTGTVNGSAYGIMKNCNNVMTTFLTPKTPVKNLFMTGQNLNLHGILGVSMTSSLTCAEIVGMDKIVSEIKLNK